MLEHVEIPENIFEGVVEPSYKKKRLDYMLTMLVTAGK